MSEQPHRPRIAHSTPRPPFLPTTARIEAGPAGSLVQARARARALREAAHGPWRRDRRVRMLAVAIAALISWLAVLLINGSGALETLVAIVLLGLVVAAAVSVLTHRQVSALEADLTRQIEATHATATALDELTAAGWVVLHDRLLTGTEHRLAHVLVGPIGVVLVTEMPEHGPLRLLPNGVLVSGDVVLTDWLDTRWWEADYLQIILTQELAHWPWNGAVIPVLIAPNSTSFPLPPVIANATVRTTTQLVPWLSTLPQPLSRLAVAHLAETLREQCEPAAVDEGRA
ncbi:hypothetical protein [Kineococcus sp. R86509]|uniref:hypothetical protein n=1 Tax=Kineococcus sp. R86509 TaxID=3093851 RepID=UPI0036D28AEF